jgi:hypothetical protein
MDTGARGFGGKILNIPQKIFQFFARRRGKQLYKIIDL